jgi:hypothetical protein
MAGINKLPVITARQNNRLQMTTEIQEEFKAFLSIKKTVIYLSIVLLALIFLLLDWPGHSFMLVGIGLFYGHCILQLLTHGLLQPCRHQSNCKSGRNVFNFFFAIA